MELLFMTFDVTSAFSLKLQLMASKTLVFLIPCISPSSTIQMALPNRLVTINLQRMRKEFQISAKIP